MITPTTTLGIAGLASALFLAPHLRAQSEPRDPFASFAQGLFLKGDKQILHKPTGDQTTAPQPFASSAAGAQFIMSELFGALAEDVVIDAMSTGNDVLPIFVDLEAGQETFEIKQVPGYVTWASLMISVDGVAGGGATPGSLLAERVTITGDRVGAELFNYWFPGNASLAADLDDDAYFVAGAEHMGLGLGADVTAFDSYLPIVAALQGGADPLVGCVDRFYYSITKAAADHIRATWTGPQIAQVFDVNRSDVRGTTVFEAQWDQVAAQWVALGAKFTAATLGLDPLVDDIDALAFSRFQQAVYGRQGDGTPVVVFSLAKVEANHFNYAQIFAGRSGWHAPLLSDSGQGPQPQDPPGVPNTRNVDAICGFDPENVISQWLGTPYRPVASLPSPYGRVGLSAQRSRDKFGQVQLELLATGLPATAGTVTFYGFNGLAARPIHAMPSQGAATARHSLPLAVSGGFLVGFWAEFSDASGAGRSWTIVVER